MPAVVELLSESGSAALFNYLKNHLSGCSHDPDDYDAWLSSPSASGVSASGDEVYGAMAKHVPGGCVCAAKSFLGL